MKNCSGVLNMNNKEVVHMTIEAKNGFVILTADEGMIFKSKISGDILTKKLYMGCNDTADNYEEISEVEAYAESDTIQEEKENGVQ